MQIITKNESINKFINTFSCIIIVNIINLFLHDFLKIFFLLVLCVFLELFNFEKIAKTTERLYNRYEIALEKIDIKIIFRLN